MEQPSNQKTSCLMFIASLVIVGTIGALRRYIPLSSAFLAFSRGVIGALMLAVVVGVRRCRRLRVPIPRRKLLGLMLNGAFLGINWMLLFEAYNHTTVAKATLCYYLQPTVVLLLSPLIFKEKLTAKKLVCAAVSLCGMVFVSGVIGAGGTPQDAQGIALGVGAACLYSLIVILNKTIGDVDVYERTAIQLLFAAVVMLPYVWLTTDFGTLTFDTTTVVLLLVLGVVYTGVVYVLYFGSMDGMRAQTLSMLSYIDPVVAMIVSVVWLGEPLTLGAAVGAVMILGSAFFSEYSPRRTRHDRNERV